MHAVHGITLGLAPVLPFGFWFVPFAFSYDDDNDECNT